MKVTFVGTGDAFNSGGRHHACLRVDAGGNTLAVEFGGTALLGWKELGFSTDDIDAIIISHLHGDHFGGLPFLLLDCHFARRRTKPLVLVGPKGFQARLNVALETFYPGSSKLNWHFLLRFVEVAPDKPRSLLGFILDVFEVDHPSGAPSYGLRLTADNKVLGFSGDTAWTPTLVDIADGTDMFICECYSGHPKMSNHIDWPNLKEQIGKFKSKRIVLTHMGETALPLIPEFIAAGLTPAHDGLVVEL